MSESSQPHCITSEQACLGSCLVDSEMFPVILEVLGGANAFYRTRHQEIFVAMERLMQAGSHIDLLTVSSQMRKDGTLSGREDIDYLESLVTAVQASAHASSYASTVAEKAFERRLLRAGRAIVGLALEVGQPPAIKLEQAGRILEGAMAGASRAQAVHLKQAATELATQLDADELRQQEGRTVDNGLSTGLARLDEVIGGILPGELTVVAGRPAMGKTAFGLGLAKAFAPYGEVYLWTSEMTRLKIARRFASMTYELPPKKVTASLASQLAEVAPNIWVDDERGLTVQRLAAKVLSFKLRHPGMAALVVDYLSNLSPDPSDYKEVSRASRKLLDLSAQLNIPIIALQQLSRKVEERPDKRPLLSDLRESGQIEQDASVVLMLHREHYYKRSADPNLAECWVRKSRDGEAGRAVKLYWDGPSTRYSDWVDRKVGGIGPSSFAHYDRDDDREHEEAVEHVNRLLRGAADRVSMSEVPL